MKPKFLLIVILFAATQIFSQNINIPDENFKNKLIEIGVDTNNDGEISFEEAEALNHTLDVSEAEINDLTGIEAFINLQKLYINNNNLLSFNLDALQGLAVLDCSYNLLTDIDVSNYPHLSVLNCSHNYIESIITSNVITQINCNYNQLDTLILENLSALHSIKCNNNSLNYFRMQHCDKNNGIHHVDISSNALENVELFNCGDINLLKIANASISNFTVNNVRAIENINLESTLIKNIDLSNVLEIEELNISNNTILETICVGILPEPFNIIDNNTSAYNKLRCSPEAGDIFYTGQISNTFNFQYNYPVGFDDFVDINGDGTDDLQFWWETSNPYGGFFSQYYMKGINGTTILKSGNSQCANLAAFSSILDQPFEWSDGDMYLGSVEDYGYGEIYEFYVGDGDYNALRTVNTNDTLYSWIKFGHNNTYIVTLESFSSWKPCHNTLYLGEDITMTTSDTIVLSAGEGYDSYFWSTGETSESIILLGENLDVGIYDYTALVSSGFCNYEDAITVEVTETSGIIKDNKLDIKLYPNPTNEFIEINTGNPYNLTFQLYSLNGQILKEGILTQSRNRVYLDKLSEGCYFIQIQHREQRFQTKIIKY